MMDGKNAPKAHTNSALQRQVQIIIPQPHHHSEIEPGPSSLGENNIGSAVFSPPSASEGNPKAYYGGLPETGMADEDEHEEEDDESDVDAEADYDDEGLIPETQDGLEKGQSIHGGLGSTITATLAIVPGAEGQYGGNIAPVHPNQTFMQSMARQQRQIPIQHGIDMGLYEQQPWQRQAAQHPDSVLPWPGNMTAMSNMPPDNQRGVHADRSREQRRQ
jgi:hypothetical protein